MSVPASHRIAFLLSVATVLPLALAHAEDNPHGDIFKNKPVPAVVDFNRDVKPFLSEKCYHCHGPDEAARKAKLRLDVRTDAVKDRENGPAIKPKDADASEVMKRIITTDPDDVMPPPKEKKALSPREIEILRKWITQGAPYAEHWAFVKPARPLPPKVPNLQSSNPIDAFISAKLAENNLAMSSPADMPTLIRRIALDLTGLPPTPEEVSTFTQSAIRNPQSAMGEMVDHYLASPAYGERWARMWLDIARYADSAGYGSDPLRLNIWPYRDWVISAFNRNMPYDQFTTEQLAGDLLPDPTQDQLVATAFHRNTMTNTEGGTDREEFRTAAVKDRIAVTVQAWMGLTMGCAQCHSHKFDPISQQDYYSFFAIFNQTEDNDQPSETPTMPLPSQTEKAKMKELQDEIAVLEKRMSDKAPPELQKEAAEWEKQLQQSTRWTPLEPTAMTSTMNVAFQKLPDQSVLAEKAESDTYTIEADTALHSITGIRLEALADDRLPGKGPGHSSGGNFVLSEMKLSAKPAKGASAKLARYVRVELPGKSKHLHLAEVEVFSNGKNVALEGAATQSSTSNDAPASLAIDGNTNGEFKSKSVTHTAQQDDPWWEVDLKQDQPVDSVVVWNRTDGGTAQRTTNFVVTVLDAARQPLFQKKQKEAPMPSATFALSGATVIKFRQATADFEQVDFTAAKAIDGKTDQTGWAVGSEFGKNHSAVFLPTVAFGEKSAGSHLTFTLAQLYGADHTLGRFRLSVTGDPNPQPALPEAIQQILATAPAQRTPEQRAQWLAYYKPISKLFADTRKQLDTKKAALTAIKPVAIPVMKELAGDRLRVSHILTKGNFLSPAEKVEPALLKNFNPVSPNPKITRLTVARWLMSRDNPLTARVMVNRLWAQLFGIGIVETEEDFGTQGMLPTHPQLLDWLAVEFMDNGWNIKALLKTIVMSQTYQQSSSLSSPSSVQIDARNLLLWHYPRRRLDSDQVRDQALALSGLLSPKIGGPSVYPPQPDGLWRAAFNGQRSWATSTGEDRFRRGLYTFWRRTVPYPSMATFDAPSRENTTLRRVPTNTPLQAFVTLNDPAYFEMAQALGARLMREGGATVQSRVRFGLELCLGRPASDEQIKALEQLYQQEFESYKSSLEDATKLSSSATLPKDKMFPKDRSPAELAAWVEVANVLLNLDGVLTKG